LIGKAGWEKVVIQAHEEGRGDEAKSGLITNKQTK
jgi:hypothetical protein